MLDDLFDMVSDRFRDKRRGSSGGLLGRRGQLLQGDGDEDQYDDRARRPRDDRRDHRDDEGDDDERDSRRGRRRGEFDLDFGD